MLCSPPPGVGASLLAKRVSHSILMQADPPLSRASSLPQYVALGWIFGSTLTPVARELAPAGLRSRPLYFFRETASSGFATAAQSSGSKLPRHGRCLGWRHREQARSHRESGLLQILCLPPPSVGASLLAKRVAHSILKLADPPLSRASPLPQWVVSGLASSRASSLPQGIGVL
jgi:hypothetical protein